MSEPILSIYIITYNHENYIAEALDSVIKQETQYSFEVLVGEDFSTDNTRKILENYEKNYPGFFTMYYRDHNMYSESIRNSEDLLMRCRGKYVLLLEGDDFWTDPLKIEKQIKFLESNPEYYAVAHNCIVVGDDSKPNGDKYPECTDEEYTYKHYFCGILPGQITTLMYRNYYKDPNFYNDYPSIPSGMPGDLVTAYKLLLNGRIFCIQEKMSAYRHVSDKGDSFSATYKYSIDKWDLWYKCMLLYTEKHKAEWVKYVKMMFITEVLRGYRSKNIDINKVVSEFKENHLSPGLIPLTRRYINRHLFKKNII